MRNDLNPRVGDPPILVLQYLFTYIKIRKVRVRDATIDLIGSRGRKPGGHCVHAFGDNCAEKKEQWTRRDATRHIYPIY